MKLIGYIDGEEVTFDYFPPNKFVGTVPKNLKGVYTVELQATDDAGNISGMADMFVMIDFDKLSFKILDKDFIDKTERQEYEFKELQQEFIYKELV